MLQLLFSLYLTNKLELHGHVFESTENRPNPLDKCTDNHLTGVLRGKYNKDKSTSLANNNQ